MAKKQVDAVAYLRTSSAANVGSDKDSDKRQLRTITSFAAANGFAVVETYYDAAVSGADPVNRRPGFVKMLERVVSNGVRTILVESPDRFARDLAVQLAGHDMLKSQGIALIPATAPDFFTADTPTAVLVRQVLGAIAQFEKATMVAKLSAARKRKRETTGKCEGRKSHEEQSPEVVELVKRLRRRTPKGRRLSLREIAARLATGTFFSGRGPLLNKNGRPYNPKSIASMLNGV
jgi:DNA invertase Pin-like site-specific DNA recombinase